MADKNNIYTENIAGPFYVDKECINCDACILVASKHFKLIEGDDGHAFVYNQPKTEEDIEACKEAMESCPVECIGDDGI